MALVENGDLADFTETAAMLRGLGYNGDALGPHP